MEKRKDAYIRPGSDIDGDIDIDEDGESYWPPEKRKRPAFIPPIPPAFGSNMGEDGESYWPSEKRKRDSGERTPEPPHDDVEDLDVPLPFLKQPIRDGMETREELYAYLKQFAKPYPLEEEEMLKWCCALKNPKLIDDPNVIEIREEDVITCPFLPYTCLPLFKQNREFHDKLKLLAEKMVQHFNCSNDENLCFDEIEEVAAAPGRRYMLDIIVFKGDFNGLRSLTGRVCDGEIEDVWMTWTCYSSSS